MSNKDVDWGLNDEPAEAAAPVGAVDWGLNDAPAAREELPTGVKASTAGAGRGRVNPPTAAETAADATKPSFRTARPTHAATPGRRESVLQDVQEPNEPLPISDAQLAENVLLSRRDYVERTPAPGAAPQQSIRAVPIPKHNRDIEAGRNAAEDGGSPVRIVGKAVAGAAEGMYGAARAGAENVGAEKLGSFFGHAADAAKDYQRGMGEPDPVETLNTSGNPGGLVPGAKQLTNYLAKQAEGAASSFGTSAATAAVFGPAAVIPLLTLQQAGQSYNEARNAGQSPGAALAYAVPFGLMEAVGEKLGGTKAGMQGLRTLLSGRATRAEAEAAVKALNAMGVREIPSELVTYLGQSAIDKIPGIGMKPNMGWDEFVSGAIDTVVQAGMMGAMAHGSAAVGDRLNRAPRPQKTAEQLARDRGFLVREEQAKKLATAGEKEIAAGIQKQVDTERAESEIEELSAKPWAQDAAFQDRYRQLRSDGKKPAEAAARAAMAAAYGHLGTALRVPEAVWRRAVDAAAALPMDKVPAFFEKFTASLVKKGLSEPAPDGTVAGAVAGVRDDAVSTTIASTYPDAAAAPPAPDETAQAITELEAQQGAEVSTPEATMIESAPEQAAPIDAPAVDFGETDLTPNEYGAHQGASSPLNDKTATKAQILAGVAPLGHMKVGGIGFSVENAAGSERVDLKNEPPKWKTPMQHGFHYGYFKRTEGNDGDHFDAFVKEGTPEDYDGPVFVVDQVNRDGSFDEHKAVIGPQSEAEAREAYLSHYEKGWTGLGAITEVPMAEFRRRVRDGKQTEPFGRIEKAQAAAPAAADTTATPGRQGAAADAGAGSARADGGDGAPAVAPLRLGMLPNDAQPVTVRNGVVHIGDDPALNYDSGEPVQLADGATDDEIKDALKKAGAVSRKQKFFGGAKAPATQEAAKNIPEIIPAATGGTTAVRWDAMTPKQRLAFLTQAGASLKSRDRVARQPWADLAESWQRSLDRVMGPGKAETPPQQPVTPAKSAPTKAADYSPLRAFLREVGVHPELMADLTGERSPFRAHSRLPKTFRPDGARLDKLVEQAREVGFLPREGDDIDHGRQLVDMVHAELRGNRVQPQFDGNDEERLAAEVARRRPEPELDDLTPDDLESEGYTAVDAELQQRVRELMAQAEQDGVDVEGILEDVAKKYENATQDEYLAVARQAIESALAGTRSAGAQDRGGPAGAPSAEPQAGEAQGLNPATTREQDLLGDTPNASQQAAARLRAERDEKKRRQQIAAPGADGFELGMVDTRMGQEVAPGQADLLAAPTEAATPRDARQMGLEAGQQGAARNPPDALTNTEKQQWRAGWDQSKRTRGATPQVASDAQLRSLIAVAADSIDKLRKSDVDRVLSEAPAHFRTALGEYIKSNRPDLADEVRDIISELRPAAAPAPKAESAPRKPSGNTLFTDDAAEKARALLRAKLNIKAGPGGKQAGSAPMLDPEVLQAGLTLAGWHIEHGARTFAAFAKAMLEDMGEAVRPYLKSWYMGVKYDPRAGEVAKDMSSAAFVEEFDVAGVQVENPAAADDTAKQENDDVPGADDSVERDREGSAAEPRVEPPVPAGAAGTAQGAGGRVRAPGSRGGGRSGAARVRAGGTPAGGERIDQRVPGGNEPEQLAGVDAGSDIDSRGSGPGVAGVSADGQAAAGAAPTAGRGTDEPTRRARQLEAERVPVKPGDLENIRATLPCLLEKQQEDVQKAEARFAKDAGYGIVFTNGTGTGKTFTGLGIVKRFQRQGRKNILIVVPDAKIAADWVESGKPMGLPITQLPDTKRAGAGIVITTYANLGVNDELARRDWDLIVPDEAHSLMQSADAGDTLALDALRAISLHPRGAFNRFQMLNRDDLAEQARLSGKITANAKIISNQDTMDAMVADLRAENTKLQAQLDPLTKKLAEARRTVDEDVAARQGVKRTRVAALSATPFAYEKTIDWAEGYLFDYAEDYPHKDGGRGYNTPDPREHFFITHFGYRMRYGKLTEPDAKVDRGLMQRQFNAWLKKRGALSGRQLEVDADYDRRFVLLESAVGNDIDRAIEWLDDKAGDHYEAHKDLTPEEQDLHPNGYDFLRSDLRATLFGPQGHLMRRYLLEAIKAKEVVADVRAHLALGRKVVVFHDFKKGGATNPFQFFPRNESEAAKAEPSERPRVLAAIRAHNRAVDGFDAEFPALSSGVALADLSSPIERFTKEFPGVLLINGDEKSADLLRRYKEFNDDATGPVVALVQSAKNKGWSGHDTTGKHPRVLFNLGLPTQPTMSIQQEGRIYRTGQVSNALFRYLNTGTNWERWAFAQTIASRSSTAENLGMGEQARALRDAFIAAFEESSPEHKAGFPGEGTGGKERDRVANSVLSEFDRAKAFYWATEKKTSKTKAQEGKDYFATPEPLGLKMVEWANVRGSESVLEPSAGHGAIARWFPDTVERTAIEPSTFLSSRLALVFDGKIERSDFESHHVVNKYDAIVMNPPFGHSGKTAVDHLAKAATHLRDGGRIVALIPTGPAADKQFDKWFYGEETRPAKPLGETSRTKGGYFIGDIVELDAREGQYRVEGTNETGVLLRRVDGNGGIPEGWRSHYISKIVKPGPRTESYRPAAGLHMVAQITLPQSTFERAGTGVAARVVVLEKSDATIAPATYELASSENIGELFDRLENLSVKERAKPAEEAAPTRATPTAARPAPAPAVATVERQDGDTVVEHVTAKGKTLRGVVRKGITQQQAKEIDAYTFKKDGGWFIREKYLKAAGEEGGNDEGQLARAFHGTPHQVDRFTTDKIGTGEGAQAYGWGLYFAENDVVAKQYASKIKDMPSVTRIYEELRALASVIEAEATPGAYRQFRSEKGRSAATRYDELLAQRDAIYNAPGKVYTVEIPDDVVASMLLWDKPLSDQPAAVRAALAKLDHTRLDAGTRKVLAQYGESQVGAAFYRMLVVDNKVDGQENASKLLESLGIRGIRYLDGDSRNRPLKEVRREFLAELPEDAGFDEVLDLLGTGTFSAKNEAVIKALAADDWLGFDYPAQALSAALSRDLANFDASPALVKAVEEAQQDATYNLVVFNGANVEITHKDGTPVEKQEREEAIATFARGLNMREAAERVRGIRNASATEVQAIVAEIAADWKSGPVVHVVDSPSQFPIQAPDDARGLHYRGEVWIAANAHRADAGLQHRVAVTLAHESIAHFGLRKLLGDKAFTKMLADLQLAIASGNKPLREIREHVRRNYRNEDGSYTLTKRQEADEIAARATEMALDDGGNFRPGFSWLKAVWSQLAQALRAIGFKVQFTNVELQGLLARSLRGLADGESAAAPEFAGAQAARADTFGAAVDSAIAEAIEGKAHSRAHIDMGAPSGILLAAGVPNAPLRTAASALSKAHIEHGVPKAILRRLPELLDQPAAVFDSDTVRGSFVVLTKEVVRERPLLVVVTPEQARGGVTFNFVPTLYPKDKAEMLKKWAKDGLLRWADKEASPRWIGSFRAPIARGSRPTEGSSNTLPPDEGDGQLARGTAEPPLGGWIVPEDTTTDKVIFELQDGRVDLKRIQQAMQKAQLIIDEKFDARLAETLYPGRVARRTETFMEREAKPLLKAMARIGASLDELGDYLLARHAPERNEQIAKVNPDLVDGGAGSNSKGELMTTYAAKAYIEAIPAARRALLEELAQYVDRITKGTRELLVAEGLEKRGTVDAWEAVYKHYAPLFKDEATGERPHPIGTGFTVKGPASKRAMGSTKQVTDVLAHVFMQREAAITRAEKNRVAMSLYGLALSHPNREFWTTIRPNMGRGQLTKELKAMGVDPALARSGMETTPTIRYIDDETGLVAERPNPFYKSLPGAIVLRVNGEDRVLMFNEGNARAMRLAADMKNLDGLTRLDIAGSVVGKATRWIASLATQYNPAFGLKNFVRDAFDAALNLSTTPLRRNKAKVLAQIPFAMQGIARWLSAGDATTSEWGKLWQQFQDDGGRTGYREMFAGMEERARKIESELKQFERSALSPARAGRMVLQLLDGFNLSIENAVRLSAYATALDQGLSRAEAARLARELTVDFNRKGRSTRELSPLYAFFNASVQGIGRTGKTLAGPAGAKIIVGGLTVGVLQALMLLAADYDDDEIPDWAKARSLIFPLPKAADGQKRYISVPLPLGFQVLPNTGRVITELVLNGGKNAGKSIFNAVAEIGAALNPLGGGNIFTLDGALKTIAPTVLDPFIEAGFNRNFAGRPIERAPQGHPDPRPGYQRAKESTLRSPTGQAYLAISKALNSAFGGTAYEAGGVGEYQISPTPEMLRHWTLTVGGGLLREVEKGVDSAVSKARGEPVKPYRLPVVGSFYGEVDAETVEHARYFEAAKRIDRVQSMLKKAEKAGDGEAIEKILTQHPEAALIRTHDKLQRKLAELNRLAVTTVDDRESMKVIDEARTELMRGLNEAIRELEGDKPPTPGQRLTGKNVNAVDRAGQAAR